MTKNQKIAEIIKILHLQDEALEIIIPNLVRTGIQAKQKQGIQEEVVTEKVIKKVKSDDFVSQVMEAYENLADDEVEAILSFYKYNSIKNILGAISKGANLCGKAFSNTVFEVLG